MVEWVNAQHVARDTASALEEVDKLTDVILVDLVKLNQDIRHAAVDVCEACTEFSHLVDFIHTLACQEVESVEVLLIHWHAYFAVCLIDRDHGLEDRTLTILDPLTH